jgi:Zeta toxin
MLDGTGDIADLFDQQIRPYVFGGHRPSAAPRLVLVGAQPGAGKSYAIARIVKADADADFVYVTGDALRPFHPAYAALVRSDPVAMPNATGPAVATWVRSCIDHALAERFTGEPDARKPARPVVCPEAGYVERGRIVVRRRDAG